MPSKPAADRIISVDVVRSIASIAVVLIHTTPFHDPQQPLGHEVSAATVINHLCRFAVPLFFMLSGYLWSLKCETHGSVLAPSARMVRRLAFLCIAWSCIYLIPWNLYDAASGGAEGLRLAFLRRIEDSKALTTLVEGTKWHLWFLISLTSSVVIAACFRRAHLRAALVVFALVLFLVGLSGRTYSDTPWGFQSRHNFRNGPFLALLCFVTGSMLQRRPHSVAWLPLGVCVAVAGVVVHLVELYTLHAHYGTWPPQDYTVGVFLFGLGATLIALSDHPWVRRLHPYAFGQWALGIYLTHVVFVELLQPVDRLLAGSMGWTVVRSVTVLIAACCATWLLCKHPLTRKLVT